MRIDPESCFECGVSGQDKELHQHHVVPRSRGGNKTLPLCHSCHDKAHHTDTLTLAREKRAWMRKHNKYLGGPLPYGKRLALNRKDLLVNGPELELMEKVLRLYNVLENYHAVSRTLNAEHIRWRGGKFTHQKVYSIIKHLETT